MISSESGVMVRVPCALRNRSVLPSQFGDGIAPSVDQPAAGAALAEARFKSVMVIKQRTRDFILKKSAG